MPAKAVMPQFNGRPDPLLADALTKVSPQAQAKAKATATDFEAMFLNSMFSQMTSGIKGEGPFGDTPGTGVWRSMLTEQYSKILRQGRRRRNFQRRLPHADPAASQPRRLIRKGNRDMNQRPQSRPAPASAARPAASTPPETRKLAEDLMDVMSALLGVIERETELVRAGKIREAMAWKSRSRNCRAAT